METPKRVSVVHQCFVLLCDSQTTTCEFADDELYAGPFRRNTARQPRETHTPLLSKPQVFPWMQLRLLSWRLNCTPNRVSAAQR